MSKKGTKALASATLMSLVLTTALSAGPVKAASTGATVTRTSGSDRYATAASVATANWTTSDDVVLVSGEGYADAVSASALAKKLNAPILLTSAGSLSSDTQSALTTLKAKNVYVIGGNASVSDSVRSDLKKSYNLIELGGANRYETNAKVAQKLVDLGVKADQVIMVGGEGFSDALSVAPIAAAKGQILLLGMNNSSYMQPVLDFVKNNSSKVTVVGTSNVINDSILSTVNGTRIDGGSDRFDTNLKVLNAYKDTVKMDKMYVANASNDGYADALVASAVAGKTGAPLVLVDTDGSTGTTNAIKYITSNETSTTAINIIGGTGVVSQNVEDELKGTNPDNHDATVQSVETVNLNEIKIHFNSAVDQDSAEDVSAYKIDGVQLTPVDANNVATTANSAVAHQIDDNTVSIVLATPRKQNDNVTVSVKKQILTKDKGSIVAAFDQAVTFKDTEAPTVKSVTVEGNSQLTVEFSEAVNMKTIDTLKNKFKIDGQSLGNVNTTYSVIKNKVVVPSNIDSNTPTWAYKVMFYFDSPIASGTHTLKISDGDTAGVLSDAAGWTFQEASQDFSVDTMTTQPTIKSIKETSSGEVHITFDRPMDVQTAEDPSNWELNGKNLYKDLNMTTASNFDTDDNDATIKITGLGKGILTGANTMYIKNNIKDAYGNKVPDDTRQSFDDIKDETKPTILSTTVIDSQTIQVRFSKDVDYQYATNTSNYKLLDNKNVDISNHIDHIYSYKNQTDTSDVDTYNIKILRANPNDSTDDWRLNSSKYTLTVKNVIDTASTANTMDDYTTTLNGSTDVAPSGTGMFARLRTHNSDGKDQVIVYFSEPMDTATLTNKANYQFINGKGDTVSLPSGATVTVGGDNKSAIVEFPSAYTVLPSTTPNSSYDDNEDEVRSLIVANVKDEGGNLLNGVAYNNNYIIPEAKAGALVKANTLKTYYDGDDLKVDVQFAKAIDQVNAADFTLGGVTPSSITHNGDVITLTFKDGMAATTADISAAGTVTYANGATNTNPTKIALVKAQGQNAKLAINSTTTTDETGALVSRLDDGSSQTLATNQATVYDYQAGPRSTCFDVDNTNDNPNYWTASVDSTGAKVYITFDTPLDLNSGVKSDDITFTGQAGTDLKADTVAVDPTHPNTLVFSFNATNKNISRFTGSIDVRVKSSISLRTQKDADGNNANYVPSSDDIKTRTLTVNGSPVTPVTTATADLTTLTVDTASVPYTTLTTFKLNVPAGDSASNYTVTVKGVPATFGNGMFAAAINGTLKTTDFAATDFNIAKKGTTPVTTSTADLTTLTLDTASVPYTTLATFKLNVPAGDSASNYNVTVKGVPATFGNGMFAAAINGTLKTTDFAATDFVVAHK
jgi:putative cell wall-binding protein